MTLDPSRQMAHERRALLAAQRKSDHRETELRKSNSDMEQRARALTEAILEKRGQLDALQDALNTQKAEIADAEQRLKRAIAEKEQSDSRLWGALETVRDGFAIFDVDDCLVCANRAFLDAFDGLAEVAPGVSYIRLSEILLEEGIVDPGMARRDWLDMMAERWKSEQIPDTTLALWDGQFVTMTDRRIPEGGVVSLGINKTYERRLTSAIEVVPDGFVIFDRDDNIVMCNQKYRELYPGPPEMIRPGTNLYDMLKFGVENGIYPDAVGRETAWLEDRICRHQAADGTPYELRLGDETWLRSCDVPTPDGGRAGIRTEITEARNAEISLRDARETAEAASRTKSQFLTNMNHELRTPLNGIIGIASILSEHVNDTNTRRMVQTMGDSGRALLAIIENVLQSATDDRTYTGVSSDDFDLTVALSQVLLLLAPRRQMSGVSLSVDIPPDLPVHFKGDERRLRQVLTELLGNAFKFAPGTDVKLKFRGSARPGTGDSGDEIWDLEIQVEDGGPGVPPGAADKIFTPFNQAEDGLDRHHDGMGLGLSLCRKHVDLMGGAIWLDVGSQNGARFCMELALPRGADPDPIPDDLVLPSCHVVREDGAFGTILERYFFAKGTALTSGGLDDLPVDDDGSRILVVQSSLLLTQAQERLAELRRVANRQIIILGSTPLNSGIDVEDCLQVASLPVEMSQICVQGDRNPTNEIPPSSDRLRVLAAEDNRVNQLVLRKMLEKLDIELNLVENGQDAVNAVAAEPPDVILMDISMPGMDGKEATARIRDWQTETGHPHIPIIAMTAHASAEDRATILGAGLDHFLSKPLDRDALTGHIQRLQSELRKNAGASGSDRSDA